MPNSNTAQCAGNSFAVFSLCSVHKNFAKATFMLNQQFSELDINAKNKSSSLYLVDKCISMLPNNIIEQSNLKKNKVSETLSGCIELNENGSIKNYKISIKHPEIKYSIF